MFYPFFACLTTEYKLVGSTLGFLYAAIRLENASWNNNKGCKWILTNYRFVSTILILMTSCGWKSVAWRHMQFVWTAVYCFIMMNSKSKLKKYNLSPIQPINHPRARKYWWDVDQANPAARMVLWEGEKSLKVMQWKTPGHQWHFQNTLAALFLASLGVQVVLILAYICHEKIELSLDIAFDEICKLIKWGWIWYREEFFSSRRLVWLRRITAS